MGRGGGGGALQYSECSQHFGWCALRVNPHSSLRLATHKPLQVSISIMRVYLLIATATLLTSSDASTVVTTAKLSRNLASGAHPAINLNRVAARSLRRYSTADEKNQEDDESEEEKESEDRGMNARAIDDVLANFEHAPKRRKINPVGGEPAVAAAVSVADFPIHVASKVDDLLKTYVLDRALTGDTVMQSLLRSEWAVAPEHLQLGAIAKIVNDAEYQKYKPLLMIMDHLN